MGQVQIFRFIKLFRFWYFQWIGEELVMIKVVVDLVWIMGGMWVVVNGMGSSS